MTSVSKMFPPELHSIELQNDDIEAPQKRYMSPEE